LNDQDPQVTEQTEAPADTAAAPPAKEEAPPAKEEAPARKSSAVGWLALLLVVVLAASGAWLVREGQHREEVLAQRLTALESEAGSERAGLDAASDRWQAQLRTGLAELEETLEEQTADLSQRLDAREAQLQSMQDELGRFSATDRDSWLLAEAGYLLRLANQQLVMSQDPVASLALLNGADAVLLEIDDPSLHEVRAALAADIASLRAVPRVDIEGIYLRLAALVEQAGELVIFQLPERAEGPAPEPAEDWEGRLRQGYQAALAKLSGYLIIRRRDVPMQALMDPQWEGLVRQNLRMLLEQAQVALLSGNQAVYEASLERAQHWVDQFMDSDESAARAMAYEIRQLADLTIGVPQPDISRSLQAMDAALEQREHVQGGQ
jgi:uroporphyrin-3 C-methyltransferase